MCAGELSEIDRPWGKKWSAAAVQNLVLKLDVPGELDDDQQPICSPANALDKSSVV